MEQDTCWFFCNMTGRDINGAICMTRSGALADMCGTFSYSTHYVPFMNYCGENNMGLLEGTYLAMRHELKLGNETYKMRRGSKVRLYLPSTIAYARVARKQRVATKVNTRWMRHDLSSWISRC